MPKTRVLTCISKDTKKELRNFKKTKAENKLDLQFNSFFLRLNYIAKYGYIEIQAFKDIYTQLGPVEKFYAPIRKNVVLKIFSDWVEMYILTNVIGNGKKTTEYKKYDY